MAKRLARSKTNRVIEVANLNMDLVAQIAVDMVCNIVGCTKEFAIANLQEEIHITACGVAAVMAADAAK